MHYAAHFKYTQKITYYDTKHKYLWHMLLNVIQIKEKILTELCVCVCGVSSVCMCSTPPTSISVVTPRAHPAISADTFTGGLVAVAVRAVCVPAWISAELCRTRTESNQMQLVTVTGQYHSSSKQCHCDWMTIFVKFIVSLTKCRTVCVPHTEHKW